MNKKIILSIGALASVVTPLATVVACENKVNYINDAITESKAFLSDSTNLPKVENHGAMIDGKWMNINIYDSVDKIIAPEVVAIQGTDFNLLDIITFVKAGQKLDVTGSRKIGFRFTEQGWKVDAKGKISAIGPKLDATKTVNQSELIIDAGNGVQKTIKIQVRPAITNHKVSNFSKVIGKGINITTTKNVVAGTGFDLNGKKYESLNLNFEVANTEGIRVNAFANLNKNEDGSKVVDADLIKVNGTANYVGMLFHVDKSFEGKEFWVRTAWNQAKFSATDDIDSGVLCYDFNVGGHAEFKVDQGGGWIYLEQPIDSSYFDKEENFLSVLRIIQLKESVHPKGTIHFAGVFESDAPMNKDDLIKQVELP